MVTNRFVADSFMRFVVTDNGRYLFRAMRPAGMTGAPHETVSAKSRNWTLFDVAKLTHPVYRSCLVGDIKMGFGYQSVDRLHAEIQRLKGRLQDRLR